MFRPVAQLAERRSPKPQVGGSTPSWPAISRKNMTKILTSGKLVGFVIFLLTALALFVNYRYANHPWWMYLLGWAGWLALVSLLIYRTPVGQFVFNLAIDARQELKRVVWPNRQEVVQTTIAMMIIVVIMSLFLWSIDAVLLWAINFLTGMK